MKISTVTALIFSGSLLLTSCGEHTHDHDKPESTISEEAAQEIKKKIEIIDNSLQDLEKKETELDHALEDLDI